jgi:hypothetical protein
MLNVPPPSKMSAAPPGELSQQQSSAAAGLADTPYFSPPRSSLALPAGDRAGNLGFSSHAPPHVRRTSNPSTRTRDRAASLTGGAQGEKKDTKEVFQDLAVQGKKGFNAFMQKLGGDKGERERDEPGFVMVGGGGRDDDGMGLQRRTTSRGHGKSQESGALKAVRAKRELDEAGKSDEVQATSCLSRDRQGVQEWGVPSGIPAIAAGKGPGVCPDCEPGFGSQLIGQNLEQFNDDLTIKIQHALATYVDIVHATAATNAQSTDVARQAVSKIDASRDSR